MITPNYQQENAPMLLLLENERIVEIVLAGKTEWKIGRNIPESRTPPDITFSSPIVSRDHGSLYTFNGQWFYVDNPKNRNGTFHNGKKIPRPMNGMKRPTLLMNGDTLRIDNEDLNQVSSHGVLMLFSTVPVEGAWTTYLFRKNITLIGSSKACNICDPLSSMSAKHAKIIYINSNYYLSDINSSSGTFLNGQKINTSVILREKDHIMLSGCHMFFLGNKLLYNRKGAQKGILHQIAKKLGFHKSKNSLD